MCHLRMFQSMTGHLWWWDYNGANKFLLSSGVVAVLTSWLWPKVCLPGGPTPSLPLSFPLSHLHLFFFLLLLSVPLPLRPGAVQEEPVAHRPVGTISLDTFLGTQLELHSAFTHIFVVMLMYTILRCCSHVVMYSSSKTLIIISFHYNARATVCVEFACSPYAFMGFLQGLPSPPTSRRCAHLVNWHVYTVPVWVSVGGGESASTSLHPEPK